jgi:superfamily I DNA/RNA helicase
MPDLAQVDLPSLPVSTVHKVKGASINAVLYVAKKGHVQALLDGTGSEEGRIGYVALTRARDLFVLAVPASCLADFESGLQAKGLQRAG